MVRYNLFSELDKTVVNYNKVIKTVADISLFIEEKESLLDEIENNLFFIQKEDREIYIDRIMHHILNGKGHLIRIDLSTEKNKASMLRDVLAAACGIPSDDYSEQQFEKDISYLMFLVRFVIQFKAMLKSFNLSISTKDYPMIELIEGRGFVLDEISENYFIFSFGNNEKKALFNGLAKGNFIAKRTTYTCFRAILGDCPITNKHEQIEWISTLQDLKMFIDTFFPNENKKWVKTANCFNVKGKEIKINSIKNLNPSHKNDPKSRAFFKGLLKEVKAL